MSGRPFPVTIRGTTYSSMSEAARCLGVTVSAVYSAKREGRLDSVGTQPIKTSSIIAKLAIATETELPALRKEAQRWILFRSKR